MISCVSQHHRCKKNQHALKENTFIYHDFFFLLFSFWLFTVSICMWHEKALDKSHLHWSLPHLRIVIIKWQISLQVTQLNQYNYYIHIQQMILTMIDSWIAICARKRVSYFDQSRTLLKMWINKSFKKIWILQIQSEFPN